MIRLEAWHREADDLRRFQDLRRRLEALENRWWKLTEYGEFGPEADKTTSEILALKDEFWRLAYRIQAPPDQVRVGFPQNKLHELEERVKGKGKPLDGYEVELMWYLSRVTNTFPIVPYEYLKQAPPSQLPLIRFQELYEVRARHRRYPGGIAIEEGYVDEAGNKVPSTKKEIYNEAAGIKLLRADDFLELAKKFHQEIGTHAIRYEPLHGTGTVDEAKWGWSEGEEVELQQLVTRLRVFDFPEPLMGYIREAQKEMGQQRLPFGESE